MFKLKRPKAVATSDTNNDCAMMEDGTSAEYIYVGTAGAVVFVLEDGVTTWTAPTVTAGQFLPMPPFRGIKQTNTTATNIFVTRRY
jgi:hypothetical protein